MKHKEKAYKILTLHTLAKRGILLENGEFTHHGIFYQELRKFKPRQTSDMVY
jgi:hypothetical protein